MSITGDAGSNDVVVERVGNQLHVAGQNGTMLTVGGIDIPEALFTVNDSFNLTAIFLGGDDVLSLQEGLQIRSANISMGDGENGVFISNTVFSGKLTIKTGSGVDFISLFRTAVTGNTLMDTGAENDGVQINETTLVGATTIRTGLGEDIVEIGNLEASTRVKCVGKLTIQTGADDDEVALFGVDTKAYAIDAGSGDDDVSVEEVATLGVMNIKTGAGEDSLYLRSVFQAASGTNVFDLGTDTDTMTMLNCSFAAAVSINLGSGDGNALLIDDVTFNGAFTLNSQGTNDEIGVETNPDEPGGTIFNRAAKFNLGFTSTVTLGVDDDDSDTQFLSTAAFKGKAASSDLFVVVSRVTFAFEPVLTNVIRTDVL